MKTMRHWFTGLVLGSAALFTPTVDDTRGQVVVSSADGRSVALPLGAL